MKKKKVAIVGIVGVPANYGGYETMVDNMLDYTPEDIEYTVYCSKPAYKERPKEYKGAKLKYFPFKANGPQALFYDLLCTIHAYFHSDTILSLGNTGTLIYPILNLFCHKRIIHNYDGYETNREKWNPFVKWLTKCIQKAASRYSAVHVADNEAMVPILKKLYSVDSVIIEYGGDGAFVVKDDKQLEEDYNLKPQEYYFNVARIEPENNIHIMLDAFAQMPEKKLVIVGNWHKNEYGDNLYKKYSDYSNMKLLNPIYDSKKINLLRSNCIVYIHPHSVGGTNPSLVEAMFLGLPIITYDVVFNRSTTEEEAIYFSDANDLIKEINKLDDNMLETKRNKMKEIAMRRYTWKLISEKYVEQY